MLIAECHAAIEDVCNDIFRSRVRHAVPDDSSVPHQKIDLSDRAILERASIGPRGSEFLALYAGQWQGRFASHSDADFELISWLLACCRGDKTRADVLFRKSGLYREKWNRNDYRERTFAVALQSTREYHTGPTSNHAATARSRQLRS
ncbi:MAG: hypothetical protein ACLQAT_20140 [Candidatus Binataceae bacterium]